MTHRRDAPCERDVTWIKDLVSKLRLAWRLVRDPLVPGWTKLIPLGALAYIMFPFDFVPDLLIGVGQLDDVAVFLLGLKMFIGLCPADIVQRHLVAMSSVPVSYRVVCEGESRLADPADRLGAQLPMLSDRASPGTEEGRGAIAE